MKFYDRTRSNIFLFTLVIGVSFFLLTFRPVLYEKKLIGLFTHNFLLKHKNSQKIEVIFNESLWEVLNNQLPLASRRRHTKFFFFIGSQNRFHLLIYIPCIQACKSEVENPRILLMNFHCKYSKLIYTRVEIFHILFFITNENIFVFMNNKLKWFLCYWLLPNTGAKHFVHV